MRRTFALLLLALSACASYTKLEPRDRDRLERDLTGGAPRYLRLSYYVTPMFGDASRRLLTPVAPDEVRLLNDTSGQPLNPGPAQAILPAGTRARITRVEHPTAWVTAERVVYSPRYQPWIYLEVEGAPEGPPLVLVLRQGLDSPEDFKAELDRYLSERDLGPVLAALSEPVRQAVREKRAVVGMSADALEMAWGYPESIQRSFTEGVRNEEWTWPGDRRRATLANNRLIRFTAPQ